MAEAAVQQSTARFFCHQCAQEVSPVLPEYLCSRCNSGFIEELAQPAPETPIETDEEPFPPAQLQDAWNLLNTIQFGERLDRPGRAEGSVSMAGPSRRQLRQPRSSSTSRRTTSHPDTQFRDARVEGFVLQLMQSLAGGTGFFPNTNFPVFVNLHGNPDDYVFGRGHWNAIITHLINQLDGTGPPPLPKEKIEQIPTVNISQEQVDKNLQCTVCMEDFKLNEPVRLLSCQHHFHTDCIIPWLKLHGTCPICRKILLDESSQNASSGVNYSNFSLNTEPGPSNVRTDTQQSSTTSSSESSFRTRSPHSSSSTCDFADEFD